MEETKSIKTVGDFLKAHSDKMSLRLYNVLNQEYFYPVNIHDLRQMGMHKIRNMGQKSHKELHNLLDEFRNEWDFIIPNKLDLVRRMNFVSDQLTFEDLPAAVAEIINRIDRLEQLINSLGHEDPYFWGGPDWLCNYLSSDEGKPLPKPTLYGWVQNNKIPHSKKGKRLYFNKRDIDLWLREGR